LALKPLIEKVRAPIEVEQIQAVLLSIGNDFSRAKSALKSQISGHELVVERTAIQVQNQLEAVNRIFDATDSDHGFLSSVRATLAADKVDESRARALQHLANGMKQLGQQLRLSHLYTKDTQDFQHGQTELCHALGTLADRALGAGLTTESASIQQLQHRIRNTPDVLTPALNTLLTRCAPHIKVYEKIRNALAELSSTSRADTFGEQLGTRILPAAETPMSDLLRGAAPDWMLRPELSDPVDIDGNDFELSDDALRHEAALRRAADAELDALK